MRITVLLVSVLLSPLGIAIALASIVQAKPIAEQAVYVPFLSSPGSIDENGPLTVTPQLDAGRAVSATLPLEGGTIVATAANGARFTLTVPADALAYTTTVTLTPVTQVSGLPGGQLVGAVQIAPLGLFFLEAATLRIDPAQPVPAAQEMPFAYYAMGQDFHRYPIRLDVPEWSFPITQVQGGYGMAQTQTQAATQRTPSYVPASLEARTRDAIAALIQEERNRVLNGQDSDPELWSKVRALLLDYYRQAIQPILEPSKTDCAYAEANMPRAISWVRQIQLIFGDSSEDDAEIDAAQDAIMDAFVESLRNCYHEASQPCMDWNDAEQVREVLSYYRMLQLLGAEEGELDPWELPECKTIDVRLQNGSFHYIFERDEEAGYANTYHFRFVDDTVAGVGYYQPFYPPGSPLEPHARYSVTVLIDDVWQEVSPLQQFFCRDQKAERVQELKITFSSVEQEPEVAPQLYADNIGCWRWTGTIRYDWEYTEDAPELTYYANTFADVTFERKPDDIFLPYTQSGKVYVAERGYRLLPEGSVQYDELWRYVGEDYSCTNSLTLNLTDLGPYLDPDTIWPALEVPNAGFGAPREMGTGLGNDLEVNAPYTKSGDCGPKDVLQLLSLNVSGTISANGRRVQVDETGPLGEQSGTWHQVVDLRALRE